MKLIGSAAIAAMARGDAIESAAVAVMCDPPLRVWGGYGTLLLFGDAYVGLGDRLLGRVTGGTVGGVEQNVTLTLSGVDPAIAALLDAEELKDASTVIYRLIFDGSGTQLLDGRPYKRGRVDDVRRDETIGGTATIVVEIENAARGLGRNGGRMRSDADQRLVDPDDGFFKHASYAGEKQIYFGGKISAAKAGG